MPRTKTPEIITVAKPHTVKKFELIEKYVDEWARKILGFDGKEGRDGSKGVIYIDCMSNSGMYKDERGQFVEGTALRVAKRLNEIITNYPGKEAILIFNDLESARVQYLKQKIEDLELANIHIYYQSGDCNAFLRGLNLEGFKNRYNTLLLYDPYKASIDWEAITPYLNRWGEVIINHMVSDTARGAAQAKKQKVIDRYQETYQNDIESIIELGKEKNKLNKVVISIINKRRQQDRPRMYIASAPFFNRTNGLLYNLIYCSHSIYGYRLFKKITWKIFGDSSSSKNTHGYEDQLMLDFEGETPFKISTDESCYHINDIAQYIYKKYHMRKIVPLNEIYDDLDEHPIFPSEGYKDKIKDELRLYGVKFRRNGNVEFF